MSRLAEFIRTNTEPILLEWENFARSLPAASEMDIDALRDHAKKMLEVIAADLDQPQTKRQQSKKARGQSDAEHRVKTTTVKATAAQEHGTGRAESGFSVEQMVAEFRALRASVIRLWSTGVKEVAVSDIEDMIRFNEAIDQAIAESISRFSTEISESKERFLAILGHDLRTPLSAIITSSTFMVETGDQKEPYLALIKGIGSSARRMNEMVADLLDFTRTRFGDTMPTVRVLADMRKIINEVVTEVGASYPEAVIQSEITGDMRGEWDAGRIAQALTNLIANSVQHGSDKSPIKITARGTAAQVELSIQNHGDVIPKKQLPGLFGAMKGRANGANRDRRHLGLGLYIVEKIIVAHGGTVTVTSSREHGTTFRVRLPRTATV